MVQILYLENKVSFLKDLSRLFQAKSGSPTLAAPADEGVTKDSSSTLQSGQIDVRDLIARYDFDKHAELADAYFEPLLKNPILRRKPFTHLNEAIQIMSSLSHVMEGLRLFPEADILDFGAGTCWSSRILASLGCRVTALDVSKNALQIGKSIQEHDPITRDMPIDYRVFNGSLIPADDGSFDRILSFDAFHHVADQQAVLKEFARVLRDDGIVAFAEPGPHHSLTASSQMEMKTYNVIENDIRVEEIWSMAQAFGFADIKLSFAMPRQALMSLQDFNRIIEAQSAPDNVVFSPANAQIHHNRRVFFLYKSLSFEADSRYAEGLQYELRLLDVKPKAPLAVLLELEVKNTGANTWRPSGTNLGSVNIGVHLRTLDGRLIDNDYTRLSISPDRVLPGRKLRIDADLPLPAVEDFEVELDLVSENVTWFELNGGKPLRLTFRDRRYCASTDTHGG